MTIATTNPATGETVKTFDETTDDAIEHRLEQAVSAHKHNTQLSFNQRADAMLRAADYFDSHTDRLAGLATLEMGKPITQARAEVAKCAKACRYYAEHAEAFLADEAAPTEHTAYKRYLPLGPILAVMPWNFPFWQVVRFAAPALMAGNTAILKHASNVPQCALALEAVFSEAGFIPGSFNTLLIGSGKVSQLLRDSRVRAATLTGSEGAGIAVASEAAANLKKTVLELGGSDPFIVMPSAVLDDAVQTAVTARLQNNGQSCIAAKRFIVHDAIYEDFRARFVQAFEAQVIGPPDREDTDIGPLALAEGVKDLHDQVQRSIAAGASLITGGEPMSGDGFYFKPGILEAHDATLADPVFAEELFGPVALLTRVASLEAAIQTANATSFGLGSALFTRDQEDIEKAVNDLQAGATFINAMVASDPRLPFGGIKRSGYGRELAAEGIREFTNLKTVSIH